ncbi:divalent-cation tolerance protein CutA [Thiolapillus sp.]|uniref:divalent-cation tolerance protein CutA n=3 Tax=Thiolapillus sp. TaxID=2017437 RepID=UPI003AF53B98
MPVSTPELLLVLCTCPDENTAMQLAQTLVEKRLAACVSFNGAIRSVSVYRWQGEIQQDQEALLMIKTTKNGWAKLEQTLLELHPFELHPYDVPEIIAVPISAGSKDYLNWVGENICTD